METEQKPSFDSFNSFELQLGSEAKELLKGAANWGMVLAILGFIGCAFLFLFALIMFATGSMQEAGARRALQDLPVTFMGVMYLFMAVLYFIPTLFLMKFSSATKRALDENNNSKLIASFRNLKNHFMTVVIAIIIMVVMFIIFVIVAASAAMAGLH